MDDRVVKRARLELPDNVELPSQPRGHDYGTVTASGSGLSHFGDNLGIQHHHYYQQNSASETNDDKVERCNNLLKSLLFPRVDARVNNISKALHTTCTWLFKHEHFYEWHSPGRLREHNGFLWIKGKPGCGKSTIMKTTLEWAQKQARKKSASRKVIYYFFNARASTSLEKSTLGLYRFLVYQLVDLYPSLRSDFAAKFAHKEPERSGDDWTKPELQDFLSDIVHFGKPCSLYILIDALDEGEEQRDVRDMINFLVDLSENALHPNSSLDLRICLSSRHYPHISVKKGLSLTVEDQAEHDLDIETYVRKKFMDEDKNTGSDGAADVELADEICHRSAGVFLWVVLVIRLLREVEDRGGPPAEMKVLLDTIPSDLNDLFEKILTRSDHGVEACIALLQWVLFAERALGPDELFVATQYSRSPADKEWIPLQEIKVPSDERLSLYILECSRGLVELTSAQPPNVQFIHETVRDYLLHSNGFAALLPALSTNLVGISHEVLKTSCSRYIAVSKIPDDLLRFNENAYGVTDSLARVKERLRSELPMIEYSITYILRHAEQAQIHCISQEDFLNDWILAKRMWQDCLRLWRNIFERFAVRKYSATVTLQYFLAEQGLETLLKLSLKASPSSTNVSGGRYGTALSVACANGHADIARILIANGAEVNAHSGEHGHPLLSAIYNKHYNLVPLLSSNGARPDHRLLNKAMFEMIARGSLEGFQSLLQAGADVNVHSARGQSTLQQAMLKKRPEIVDFLVDDARLDVKSVWNRRFAGENDLVLASKMGYINVVRLLLQGLPGSRDSELLSDALSAAIVRERVEIQDLLLESGAQFYPSAIEHGILLQRASGSGRLGTVRLLVCNTAHPDASEHFGEALLYACNGGYMEIARILIASGADVDFKGEDGVTALQVVCSIGHRDIAQLLIEKGAHVNAQGKVEGAALQVACRRGYLDIAQLLIKNSADINLLGGECGSALHAAVTYGMTKTVKLLIQSGADVNVRAGVNRETALKMISNPAHYASRPDNSNDFEDIRELLLAAGAK